MAPVSQIAASSAAVSGGVQGPGAARCRNLVRRKEQIRTSLIPAADSLVETDSRRDVESNPPHGSSTHAGVNQSPTLTRPISRLIYAPIGCRSKRSASLE